MVIMEHFEINLISFLSSPHSWALTSFKGVKYDDKYYCLPRSHCQTSYSFSLKNPQHTIDQTLFGQHKILFFSTRTNKFIQMRKLLGKAREKFINVKFVPFFLFVFFMVKKRFHRQRAEQSTYFKHFSEHYLNFGERGYGQSVDRMDYSPVHEYILSGKSIEIYEQTPTRTICNLFCRSIKKKTRKNSNLNIFHPLRQKYW